MLFRDRSDAGEQLAKRLASLKRDSPIVIALPCGGVPVGEAVAAALEAPLDVCGVRRLCAAGAPDRPVGAVAEGGVVFAEEPESGTGARGAQALQALIRAGQQELDAQVGALRRGHAPLSLAGRTVIVVDDGIATGWTARAALRAVRTRLPSKIVLAVPVAEAATLDALAELVDEVVCIHATPELYAVSAWYESFDEVPLQTVIASLTRAQHRVEEARRAACAPSPLLFHPAGGVLRGNLLRPQRPRGVVIFAHGTGSSRASPRNQYVAERLSEAGYAAVLIDLLTDREVALEREEGAHFDVGLLASRLLDATEAVRAEPSLRDLPTALFGCSAGAAPVLAAAASSPGWIDAVICRGGHTALAGSSVRSVVAPTLLIVGGEDARVLEQNRQTLRLLGGPSELLIIPHASARFEEAGALSAVSDAARGWLDTHLGYGPSQGPVMPGIAS